MIDETFIHLYQNRIWTLFNKAFVLNSFLICLTCPSKQCLLLKTSRRFANETREPLIDIKYTFRTYRSYCLLSRIAVVSPDSVRQDRLVDSPDDIQHPTTWWTYLPKYSYPWIPHVQSLSFHAHSLFSGLKNDKYASDDKNLGELLSGKPIFGRNDLIPVSLLNVLF